MLIVCDVICDKKSLLFERNILEMTLCVKQNPTIPPDAGLWVQLLGVKWGLGLSKDENTGRVPRGLIMQEGEEIEEI